MNKIVESLYRVSGAQLNEELYLVSQLTIDAAYTYRDEADKWVSKVLQQFEGSEEYYGKLLKSDITFGSRDFEGEKEDYLILTLNIMYYDYDQIKDFINDIKYGLVFGIPTTWSVEIVNIDEQDITGIINNSNWNKI